MDFVYNINENTYLFFHYKINTNELKKCTKLCVTQNNCDACISRLHWATFGKQMR